MSYETDLYYNPQAHGLEIFGEVEFIGGYEFDKFVVWKPEKGKKWYFGTDSGCSCYSPFEARTPNDLQSTASVNVVIKALQAYAYAADLYYGEGDGSAVVRLIERLIAADRERK